MVGSKSAGIVIYRQAKTPGGGVNPLTPSPGSATATNQEKLFTKNIKNYSDAQGKGFAGL